MRTISIISQKGGAGKTTLATHLAAAAFTAGKVSLIIDTDPQATASRWGQWRGDEEPEVIDCGAPSLLASKLEKSSKLGAEIAVIDTPPHADAMARQAARLADLILVPCRPKAFDLAAIEATADLVRESQKPAFVIFMAGPPRAQLIYREASDLIGGGNAGMLGLRVSPIMMPERAAFHHSTAQGKTAPDYDPDGKASTETSALWAWAWNELEVAGRARDTICQFT